MNNRIAPRYIGCLTNPYTPVEITVCFRSDCILTNGDRKVLSVYDRKKKKNDRSNPIPPTAFNQIGNDFDHSNLFASKGIIIIQTINPMTIPTTTYLSHPFWLASPGFFIPLIQQFRIMAIQIKDGRKAHHNKPTAKNPTFYPKPITCKEKNYCWK